MLFGVQFSVRTGTYDAATRERRFDGTRYVATPVFLKSANLITAMSANGYVRISKDEEGIYKDAPLKVIPLEL